MTTTPPSPFPVRSVNINLSSISSSTTQPHFSRRSRRLSETPSLRSTTSEIPFSHHSARSNCLACQLKKDHERALQETNPYFQRRLMEGQKLAGHRTSLPAWKPVGSRSTSKSDSELPQRRQAHQAHTDSTPSSPLSLSSTPRYPTVRSRIDTGLIRGSTGRMVLRTSSVGNLRSTDVIITTTTATMPSPPMSPRNAVTRVKKVRNGSGETDSLVRSTKSGKSPNLASSTLKNEAKPKSVKAVVQTKTDDMGVFRSKLRKTTKKEDVIRKVQEVAPMKVLRGGDAAILDGVLDAPVAVAAEACGQGIDGDDADDEGANEEDEDVGEKEEKETVGGIKMDGVKEEINPSVDEEEVKHDVEEEMKADVEEEVKVDVVEEECKAEVVEKQEKGEDAEEHEKVVEDTVVCLDNDSQEKVTARVVSDVVAEIGDVAFPEAESIEISEHPVENDIKAVEVQNDAGEAAVEAENVDEAEMVPESIVADDAEVGEQLESNAAEEVEVDQQPESVSVEEATEDRGAEVETQASSASDENNVEVAVDEKLEKEEDAIEKEDEQFSVEVVEHHTLDSIAEETSTSTNDEDSTFSSQSVPTLVTTTTHSGHIITGKTFTILDESGNPVPVTIPAVVQLDAASTFSDTTSMMSYDSDTPERHRPSSMIGMRGAFPKMTRTSSSESAGGHASTPVHLLQPVPIRRLKRRQIDMSDLTGLATLAMSRLNDLRALQPALRNSVSSPTSTHSLKKSYLSAAKEISLLGKGIATAWGPVARACTDRRLKDRLSASLAECETSAGRMKVILKLRSGPSVADRDLDAEGVILSCASAVVKAAQEAVKDLEAARILLEAVAAAVADGDVVKKVITVSDDEDGVGVVDREPGEGGMEAAVRAAILMGGNVATAAASLQ